MEDISLTAMSNHQFTEESIFIPLHGTDSLHLKRFCGSKSGKVIFMLHGTIENGRIFYSKSNKGLAPFLARHGYDVFVADLRGKGLSTPHINKNSHYGLSEAIHEEIPAFIEQIKKIRGSKTPQTWVAHSWGGILLLCHYAQRANSAEVASMIFFGTKRRITVGGVRKFWMINIFYSLIFKSIISVRGFVDVKKFGMGSENETDKSRSQTFAWVTHDEWKDENGFDYAAALSKINLPPLLFIAGGSDEVLGHETDVRQLMQEVGQQKAAFYLAAKSNGNKHNYDHITMLTHPDAPGDHFQFVLQWLSAHSNT